MLILLIGLFVNLGALLRPEVWSIALAAILFHNVPHRWLVKVYGWSTDRLTAHLHKSYYSYNSLQLRYLSRVKKEHLAKTYNGKSFKICWHRSFCNSMQFLSLQNCKFKIACVNTMNEDVPLGSFFFARVILCRWQERLTEFRQNNSYSASTVITSRPGDEWTEAWRKFRETSKWSRKGTFASMLKLEAQAFVFIEHWWQRLPLHPRVTFTSRSQKQNKEQNVSRVKNTFYYSFGLQRQRTCSAAKLLLKVTVFVGWNPIAASRGDKSHWNRSWFTRAFLKLHFLLSNSLPEVVMFISIGVISYN